MRQAAASLACVRKGPPRWLRARLEWGGRLFAPDDRRWSRLSSIAAQPEIPGAKRAECMYPSRPLREPWAPRDDLLQGVKLAKAGCIFHARPFRVRLGLAYGTVSCVPPGRPSARPSARLFGIGLMIGVRGSDLHTIQNGDLHVLLLIMFGPGSLTVVPSQQTGPCFTLKLVGIASSCRRVVGKPIDVEAFQVQV
jgi:hypothetical protein